MLNKGVTAGDEKTENEEEEEDLAFLYSCWIANSK